MISPRSQVIASTSSGSCRWPSSPVRYRSPSQNGQATLIGFGCWDRPRARRAVRNQLVTCVTYSVA